MFNLFEKKQKTVVTDPLILALNDYASFDRPHLGCPSVLTMEQVRENIDHLNRVHDDRVRIVLQYLARQGIELGQLQPEDFFKNLDVVDDFLEQELLPKVINSNVKLFNKKKFSFGKIDPRWPPSFEGEYIIFSFIQDLVILCFDRLKNFYSDKAYWTTFGNVFPDASMDFDPDDIDGFDSNDNKIIIVGGLMDKDTRIAFHGDIEHNFFHSISSALNNSSAIGSFAHEFGIILEILIPIEGSGQKTS